MKAKDFLKQIEKIDTMIKNKLIEKSQWYDIATNVTSVCATDKVQTSNANDKMAEAVCKYTDLATEIDEDIKQLIDTKKTVLKAIEELTEVEYDLLHKVYIQSMAMEDIAKEWDKTYTWVTTVHGRALKNLQKIIDRG